MTNVEKEVLLITQEECAEVVQAISKCFRFGMNDSYNGKTNRESLVLELGDLQCMIDLIKETKLVSTDELNEAVRSKRERLEKWSSIFSQKAAQEDPGRQHVGKYQIAVSIGVQSVLERCIFATKQ